MTINATIVRTPARDIRNVEVHVTHEMSRMGWVDDAGEIIDVQRFDVFSSQWSMILPDSDLDD